MGFRVRVVFSDVFCCLAEIFLVYYCLFVLFWDVFCFCVDGVFLVLVFLCGLIFWPVYCVVVLVYVCVARWCWIVSFGGGFSVVPDSFVSIGVEVLYAG